MPEHASHHLAFDSERQYLGKVYAKALLNVTERQGTTEKVLEELRSFIEDVLEKVPHLEEVLISPRIELAAKLQLLDKIAGNQLDRHLLNFLKVAARHGRLNCLREVLVAAHKQLNELRGRVEVTVESAVPLNDAQHRAIETRLREVLGADIDMHARVNAEIVGGLVIRVGDTVYDASVAQQLERLGDAILASARQDMRASPERFASMTNTAS